MPRRKSTGLPAPAPGPMRSRPPPEPVAACRFLSTSVQPPGRPLPPVAVNPIPAVGAMLPAARGELHHVCRPLDIGTLDPFVIVSVEVPGPMAGFPRQVGRRRRRYHLGLDRRWLDRCDGGDRR